MEKKKETPDEIRARLKAKLDAMTPEQKNGFAKHVGTYEKEKKK